MSGKYLAPGVRESDQSVHTPNFGQGFRQTGFRPQTTNFRPGSPENADGRAFDAMSSASHPGPLRPRSRGVETFLPVSRRGRISERDNSPQFSLDSLVVPGAQRIKEMSSPFQQSSFSSASKPHGYGNSKPHYDNSKPQIGYEGRIPSQAHIGYDGSKPQIGYEGRNSQSHIGYEGRSSQSHIGFDAAKPHVNGYDYERKALEAPSTTRSSSPVTSALLRRMEDLELKHQRECDRMRAWKDMQDERLKKQDDHIQQLMQAVRTLIQISETALDERSEDRPVVNGTFTDAQRPLQDTQSVKETRDDTMGNLTSVQQRLREARSVLRNSNPFDGQPQTATMEDILRDAEALVNTAMRTAASDSLGQMTQMANGHVADTRTLAPTTTVAGAAPTMATLVTTATASAESQPVAVSPMYPTVTPVPPSNPVTQASSESEPPPLIPVAMPTMEQPVAREQDWSISEKDWKRYTVAFTRHAVDGYLEATSLMTLITKSKVDRQTLLNILTLCDLDKDGRFSEVEFVMVMHMVTKIRTGFVAPSFLPPELKASADAKIAGS